MSEYYDINFGHLVYVGYSSFLFSGAITSVSTLILILLYISKPKLRVHPNGILFNLLVVLCLNSVKYFINGIDFWISGKNINHTALKDYAFALIPNYCWIEALITYYLFASFCGWNFAWLIDLRKSLNSPMHTTDSFVSFYALSVTIFSMVLTTLLFCIQKVKNNVAIGISQNLTCSISEAYHVYLITPLQIIYLIAAYIGLLRNPRVQVFNLFGKASKKLVDFIRIQKAYIIIFLCFSIFDFTNLIVYYSFTPYGTVGFIRIICHYVYSLSYPFQDLALTIPWILSLRKSMTTSPDELSQPLNGRGSINVKFDKREIDNSIRNEITECLLRGIRKSISYHWQYNKETITAMKKVTNFFSKIISYFSSKIYLPNFRNEEGLIHFSPDSIHKVKLLNKKEIREEASKVHVFLLPIEIEEESNSSLIDANFESIYSKKINFKTFAPSIYSNLRKLHNIKDDEIVDLFSKTNLAQKKIETKLQSGKGGSFFIIPKDGKYMLKSITSSELQALQEITYNLYCHLVANNNSIITPIYGCYSLEISSEQLVAPITFILMKNINPKNWIYISQSTRLLCFDLKGSLAGRKSIDNPKILVNQDLSIPVPNETYKDEDFTLSYRRFNIGMNAATYFNDLFSLDSSFFAESNLIDYSLLTFIMETPINNFELCKLENKRSSGRKDFNDEFDIYEQNEIENNSKGVFLDYKELQYKEFPIIYLELKEDRNIEIFQIAKMLDIRKLKFMLNSKLKKIENKQELNIFEVEKYSFEPMSEEGKGEEELNSNVQNNNDDSSALAKKFTINFEKMIPTKRIDTYKIKHLKINEANSLVKSDGIIFVEKPGGEIQNVAIREMKNENDPVDRSTKRSIGNIHEFIDEEIEIQKTQYNSGLVQIIYNPKRGGLIKRTVMFGIIDYLTIFGIRKRIEKFIKDRVMKEASVTDPTSYSKRFTNYMSNIFH